MLHVPVLDCESCENTIKLPLHCPVFRLPVDMGECVVCGMTAECPDEPSLAGGLLTKLSEKGANDSAIR